MNCLEFRRILQTEAASQEAEFLLHKRECTACAPAVQRAAGLERALRESLRIDVPEGLESRILLRHALRDPPRRRLGLAHALAASVVLAVLAFGALRWQEARLYSIEREVVSLVEYADYALAPVAPVEGARVAQALRLVGLELEAPLGAVTFASHCIVRGVLAGHLVLREGGEWGPVTVFLIPASLVTERQRFREGRWRGLLVPTPTGTVAVLGTHPDPVSLVESRVRAAVRWHLG